MKRFPWLALLIPLVLVGALFTSSPPSQAQFEHLFNYHQLVPIVVQPLPPTATPIPTNTPAPTSTPVPTVRVVQVAIPNGNFEQGARLWTQNRDGFTVNTLITNDASVLARSGTWLAWLGGLNDVTEGIYQNVRVGQYLVYAYQIRSNETSCNVYDVGGVVLSNNDGRTTDEEIVDAFDLCDETRTSSWQVRVIDVSRFAGQTRQLLVLAGTDGSRVSSFFVDDFSFQNVGLAEVAEGPSTELVQRVKALVPAE